ncbi:MAG: hypothetical protein ABS76_07525 [Pelagibacterium sp. SCN 64-44]|nr:MAG: hypothetical protein ABS76_07525 [Pelagibacterium sp. SCN 64-44]
MLPALTIFLAVFLAGTLWSIYISMTNSGLVPRYDRFVGFSQYIRLFNDARWQHSLSNLFLIFAPLTVILSLALGTFMAILIDQKIRGEGAFRFIFLYPYTFSYVVTGFAWRWLLNPELGIGQMVRDLGFNSFEGDWLIRESTVVFMLVVPAVWHAAGLVMVLMLAGLRGIDEDIWKALKVDGVPRWRAYIFVILPMLSGTVITAFALIGIGVIKVYDLVVAMTGSGPGLSSEMPMNYIMEHMFERQNLALASAGTTVILIAVLLFLFVAFILPKWLKRDR